MKKECLFIESGRGYGGATLSLIDILQHLKEEVGVHVFSSYVIRELTTMDVNNKVMNLPSLAEVKGPISLIRFYCRLVKSVIQLVNYILRNKIDILIFNNGENIVGYLASVITRKKYVIHYRGNYISTKSNNAILAKADKVIAISEWIASQLIFCGDKVEIIYDGVNIEGLINIPIKSIDNDRALVVTLVGTFAGWKGQELLVQAAALIVESHNIKYRLVGSCEGQQDEIEKIKLLISKNHLEELFSIEPFYHGNDWIDVWKESDIIIHASTKPEPFGRVIVEGMAAGKVVIASNEGGPAEIIINDKDGYLFTANDVNDLADKISGVADSYSQCDALRREARESSRKYDTAVSAEHVNNLLVKLV